MASNELNIRQEKFVRLYLLTGNATRSYKNAGYDVKDDDSAAVAAIQLLGNVKVQQALDQARQKAAEQAEFTAEQCIRELKRNADFAFEQENVNASNQALLGAAKVAGFIIDKHKDETDMLKKPTAELYEIAGVQPLEKEA